MNVYRSLIGTCWLVLGMYWVVAAIGAKRSVRGAERRERMVVRLAIVLLVVFALRIPALRQQLLNGQTHMAGNVVAGGIGVVLCALGVALAIWARVHLGANWGMPMSRKANPDLVTTGPYARVRHPIYTGILLAMLGSAVGGSVFWVLPLVLFGFYFAYSARREEAFMLSLFPEAYRTYMTHSNMLFPWPNRIRR